MQHSVENSLAKSSSSLYDFFARSLHLGADDHKD
jgi:hypothetical protein